MGLWARFVAVLDARETDPRAPPPPDPLASTARQACGCWRARTTSELCPSRASFLICCSTIVPTIVLCPLSIVV